MVLAWLQNKDGEAGEYKFYTYKESEALIKEIAAFIVSVGGQRGDRIGVYGANSPEWMITMQVCGVTMRCL